MAWVSAIEECKHTLSSFHIIIAHYYSLQQSRYSECQVVVRTYVYGTWSNSSNLSKQAGLCILLVAKYQFFRRIIVASLHLSIHQNGFVVASLHGLQLSIHLNGFVVASYLFVQGTYWLAIRQIFSQTFPPIATKLNCFFFGGGGGGNECLRKISPYQDLTVRSWYGDIFLNHDLC